MTYLMNPPYMGQPMTKFEHALNCLLALLATGQSRLRFQSNVVLPTT